MPSMTVRPMKFLFAYLVIAAVFLVLDFIWLGYVARDFYRAQLGSQLAAEVNIAAAGAFYLLYVFGILVFVVLPALSTGNWQHALLMGALLGLVAYGTFDLTNLAVMRGFPVQMALVDMAWGAFITGLSAATAVIVVARFAD